MFSERRANIMNKMWRLFVHSTKKCGEMFTLKSALLSLEIVSRREKEREKYMISFLFILKLPWNEMCNARHIFNLWLCIEIQCHRIGSDFTWYIVLIEPNFSWHILLWALSLAFNINFSAKFHSTAVLTYCLSFTDGKWMWSFSVACRSEWHNLKGIDIRKLSDVFLNGTFNSIARWLRELLMISWQVVIKFLESTYNFMYFEMPSFGI